LAVRFPFLAISPVVIFFGSISPVKADGKLSSIFVPDMLDAQIAYLETITGPAMHIYPGRDDVQTRHYPVDGCKMYAYAHGTGIIGYSLFLTPNCNFNLGNFLGSGYSSTNNLTIGKFVKAGFGADMRVQADCIYLCGNAADPTVDFTFEGPHAVNYISIVLTVSLAEDSAAAAARRWEKVIRATENEDYVTEARFNCSPKYDAAAIQAFADVPVFQITLGYEPNAALYKERCGQK
jgi:hypothetical protein